MKPQFTLAFRSQPYTTSTTRARAAYLLRAARSRRRSNITRAADGSYFIRDAQCTLYPEFIPPPDEVARREAVHYIHAAELRERIATTNNGYLFAPSAGELATARHFPDQFTVSHDITCRAFPNRIHLK